MDIGLDENFDVQLTGRNDLPLVYGQKEFEQRVRIAITELLQDAIGRENTNTTLQLIVVKTERLAQSFDLIDSIADLSVQYDTEKPNVVNLSIVYDTGDEFQAAISE